MRKTYLSDDSDEEESKTTRSNIKILVIGDKKVGKTSFITRLTRGYFTMFYQPTKNIEIHREVKIGDMLVTCWDIPPHIKYHFKLKSLEADAVILMFDTKRPETKQRVTECWKIMYKQLSKLPYIFVVGVRNPPGKRGNGIHYIDNMSTDGYNELLYHIQTTLIG